jgi:hypothetical protein
MSGLFTHCTVVGDIVRGSLTFVLKVQHTPDFSALSDALRIVHTEAKINAENTAQALREIKNEVINTKEPPTSWYLAQLMMPLDGSECLLCVLVSLCKEFQADPYVFAHSASSALKSCSSSLLTREM